VAASDIEEIVALALVIVVHVIGGLLLVWALLDDDTRAGWRRRWRRRGDDPGPIAPSPRSAPVAPRPQLPLAGADPSRLRLRGPGRLADGYPPAPRRPEHAPEPARVPR
jgi:hypothetical protein